MTFAQMPDRARRIASERVKWNEAYREKHGITTGPADLPAHLVQQVQHLCKRVFRTLDLSGYARIDLRLDAEGRIYVLEANPNPQLAFGEDFAEAAEHAGITYESLLQRSLGLGLRWRPGLAG
jgi:D-alanine-D-alanine ligase